MNNTVQQPSANHYGYSTTTQQNLNNNVSEDNYVSQNQQGGETKKEVYKKKFFKYFRKFLPLMITRGVQFASSAITLGTTAYARHSYGSYHTKKQNFAVAVSVISTFYLIALFVILWFFRQYIMPGAFFICEVVLCLLWICAFIVLADQHGKYSCSTKNASDYDSSADSTYYGSNTDGDLYYNEYTGEYTNSSYSSPCKSSKASIAFAAFSFFLFLLTSILFYQFVMKPILKNYGSWRDIFKRANQIHVPGNPDGVQLHKGSGLALTNEEGTQFSSYSGAAYADNDKYNSNDLEAGTTQNNDATGGGGVAYAGEYDDKYNTYSTQGSTAKSAGDDSYHEKMHNNANTQTNTHNNVNTIPEETSEIGQYQNKTTQPPTQTPSSSYSTNYNTGAGTTTTATAGITSANSGSNTNTARSQGQKITSFNNGNQDYYSSNTGTRREPATTAANAGAIGTSTDGRSVKATKAGTTGAGIVGKGDAQYGGYYSTDPIGDEVAGKESQTQRYTATDPAKTAAVNKGEYNVAGSGQQPLYQSAQEQAGEQEEGEHPSLIQQAVDAGKKYMNVG